MNDNLDLKSLLTPLGKTPLQQAAIFALFALGILESLSNGLMSASGAVHFFFHAENCLFVRRRLRNKTVDAIMSHGVQLPDLLETLPPADAQREFQRELAVMRSLCLKLVEAKHLAV